MASERARFARDFLFELMRDSQRLRAGYLAERERWLRSLAVDGREELLFEFEMLLRGIERYFNLHNLPLEDEGPIVARDFADELRAVRDALNRAIKLARFLVDPPSDRKLVFRKYLETRVLDERVRREMIQAELEQGSPQESLFLIRSGFVALRGVLDQLQRLDRAPYQLFADVGQLALREISLSKYFRPFRPLEFRPEYDRIKNVRLLELLQGLDPEVRRPVRTAALALYRLQHYLRYAPGHGEALTRRSLVVLALARSEIAALAAFLEGEVAARLSALGPDPAALAIGLAQTVRRETARIVKGDLSYAGAPPPGAVGRARDALLAMARGALAELAQIFRVDLGAQGRADDLLERREQARRLRADLFAFREVCRGAEQALSRGDLAAAQRAFEGLAQFVAYFHEVSYQLLRYGDLDPFDRFHAIVAEVQPPIGATQRARLAEDCRLFAAVLDRTFASIGQRDELSQVRFDVKEGRQLAGRFLTGGGR